LPGDEKNDLGLDALFLILVFLSLGFDAVFSTERLGRDLTPAKTFVVLAFGAFLLRCLLKKDMNRLLMPLRNPVTILFLLYLLVSFVSIINSRYILEPPYQAPLYLVFRRASLFMFYYCIVAIACNRTIFGYLVSAFLISGVMNCLAGIYEMVTNRAFLSGFFPENTDLSRSQAGSVRVSGLELWPGFQAGLLSMLFPFLLQYVFTSKKRTLRLSAAAMVLLFVVSIISNGSRTGWIGMFIALSVYLFFSVESKKRMLYFAGGFCLILVVFASLSLFTDLAISERIGIGRKSSGSESVSFRTTHIEMLLEVIGDYPILGIGTGNLMNSYYHYTTVTEADFFKYPPSDSHNAYLQIWAENGAIGLTVFSLLLVSVFAQILYSIKKAPDQHRQLMAYACLASFVASLWFMGLYPFLDNKYTWAVMGLCVAFANITGSGEEGFESSSHA